MKAFLYYSAFMAIAIGTILFMRWFVRFISWKIKNTWIVLALTLIVGACMLVFLIFCLFAVSMSLPPIKPH